MDFSCQIVKGIIVGIFFLVIIGMGFLATVNPEAALNVFGFGFFVWIFMGIGSFIARILKR